MTSVEAITKHPAVSRIYAHGPKIESLTDNPALQIICRLRRTLRNSKQAKRNVREDIRASGCTTANTLFPAERQIMRLLERAYERQDLLPPDLARHIAAALGISH